MDIVALAHWMRNLWVVWLMLVFLGIVAWAYWPSRRKTLAHDAGIPLRDDDPLVRDDAPLGNDVPER